MVPSPHDLIGQKGQPSFHHPSEGQTLPDDYSSLSSSEEEEKVDAQATHMELTFPFITTASGIFKNLSLL